MTTAVIMISPPGARVKEIMSLVFLKLKTAGKRVCLVVVPSDIYTQDFSMYEYVVIGYPMYNWRYANLHTSRFDEVKFVSHVPVWAGNTRRGYVVIMDSNWTTWCVRNLVLDGMEYKRAKNLVGDLTKLVPFMINKYSKIHIKNKAITELKSSPRLSECDIDDVMRIGNEINKLVHSDEYVSDQIIKRI